MKPSLQWKEAKLMTTQSLCFSWSKSHRDEIFKMVVTVPTTLIMISPGRQWLAPSENREVKIMASANMQTATTIIAYFRYRREAEKALDELRNAGFIANQNQLGVASRMESQTADAREKHEESLCDKIVHFFGDKRHEDSEIDSYGPRQRHGHKGEVRRSREATR
jgi:hypothetical protein